jgi:hypothetical protein
MCFTCLFKIYRNTLLLNDGCEYLVTAGRMQCFLTIEKTNFSYQRFFRILNLQHCPFFFFLFSFPNTCICSWDLSPVCTEAIASSPCSNNFQPLSECQLVIFLTLNTTMLRLLYTPFQICSVTFFYFFLTLVFVPEIIPQYELKLLPQLLVPIIFNCFLNY